MKPIIVPTDFSAAALSAVNYAADMALALSAPLILLHVYQIPVSMPVAGGMAGGMETPTVLIPIDELHQNAESRLAQLKADLTHISFSKVRIQTEARLGDVAEAIGESCTEHNPFLVVMGTTGHSAVERSFFGSTTLSVTRELEWPLLLVPKGTEYGKGIRSAALAWDFTHSPTELPVTDIVALLQAFNASLRVVHVHPDITETDQPVVDAVLEKMLQPVHASYHQVRGVDMGDGINDFAEKNNLDVVITVPRKHSFLESLFMKNATKDILQSTHIPMLCIHAV